MPIKFNCSSCGKKLGVSESLAGRRGKCPDCGTLFSVPASDAPPPPPPRAMRQDATDYHVAIEGPDADLLFGRLAVKAGLLTEEQVQGLIGSQARADAAGAPVSLGELCQSRRLLTSKQVQSLLLAQEYAVLRAEDKRLGQLAVRNGFATEDDVSAALDEQKRAYGESRTLPRRLGEILVEMGTLSEQQLRALLSAQARLARQGAKPTDAAPGEGALKPSSKGEPATGWLVQEAGEGAGRRFRLGAKAVLGRQPENEIPIEEDQASRQHARIEYIPLGRQHVLTDLNSRNGTYVNGEAITEPVALRDGDQVQIGETAFLYRAGPGVADEAVSPDETRPAPQVRMGSQIRRETTAGIRAQRAPHRRRAVETTEGERGEAACEATEPATSGVPAADPEPTTAPPRGRALLGRRAVLAAAILLLSVGAAVLMLGDRGGKELSLIASTGPAKQVEPETPSYPQGSPSASAPVQTAASTGSAPLTPFPPSPSASTPVAPPPLQDAGPEPHRDDGRDAQREARAKIEQAKDCIAKREFQRALDLLQEAQSLDPGSEEEIASLAETVGRESEEDHEKTPADGGTEAPPPPTPGPPASQGIGAAGGRTDGTGPESLIATAQALERGSRFDQAIAKYREILANYPGTSASGTAKARLASLRLACAKCQGLGMKCPDCGGKGTKYTTCAMCNGAGKGAGSMQAGKAGKMQNAMCPRCNGSCKHDEMCRKCGGVGRVRCSVCWALPALEGSPSAQRGKKEPALLDDWKGTLALMLSGPEGSSGDDYEKLEKDLKAKRSSGGAGESPAAVADHLGAVLMAQGKFKEASDCFAKSLSLRKEALGKDAPEVGDSLLAFGMLDAAQGKTAAALLNLDQAHLVYMTAWNAARNKEFFLLVWGAATENQPEGLAKDAMEVAQSEGRRQVKEEINSIVARMEQASLLRDLIETCELRWRFKSLAGTDEDAPPSASQSDEAKARPLLDAAEQFAKNGMKDRAIEKLNELLRTTASNDGCRMSDWASSTGGRGWRRRHGRGGTSRRRAPASCRPSVATS